MKLVDWNKRIKKVILAVLAITIVYFIIELLLLRYNLFEQFALSVRIIWLVLLVILACIIVFCVYQLDNDNHKTYYGKNYIIDIAVTHNAILVNHGISTESGEFIIYSYIVNTKHNLIDCIDIDFNANDDYFISLYNNECGYCDVGIDYKDYEGYFNSNDLWETAKPIILSHIDNKYRKEHYVINCPYDHIVNGTIIKL
jgi:hypothetical protein